MNALYFGNSVEPGRGEESNPAAGWFDSCDVTSCGISTRGKEQQHRDSSMQDRRAEARLEIKISVQSFQSKTLEILLL
jgi:hypothetical protein